mgnify:CR=1 FL=1
MLLDAALRISSSPGVAVAIVDDGEAALVCSLFGQSALAGAHAAQDQFLHARSADEWIAAERLEDAIHIEVRFDRVGEAVDGDFLSCA